MTFDVFSHVNKLLNGHSVIHSMAVVCSSYENTNTSIKPCNGTVNEIPGTFFLVSTKYTGVKIKYLRIHTGARPLKHSHIRRSARTRGLKERGHSTATVQFWTH